jgi:hypothetical protein
MSNGAVTLFLHGQPHTVALHAALAAAFPCASNVERGIRI